MTNEYGLQDLQQELLKILVDIDRVCREHNIKYSLFAGTLLGAVREKGFIPWDDDVDICFEREEYEKFMQVYPEKKNEKFVIGTVFNKCSYTVINPDPSLLDINNYNLPGPWVTIFVFDNAPKSNLFRQIKVLFAKLLMGMMGKPIHYKDFGKRTKVLFSITNLLGKLFSKKTIRKIHTKLSTFNNKKQTGFLSVYNNFTLLIKIAYDKSILDSYVDLDFEDVKVMCMSGYHEFLKRTYGDYMVPPSEKERVPKHL